ncbi:MAG TPA: aldehyde dehydrogenase family protein [Solirubrobacteraceae bacterium]|jgi:acyl-CoA reductase-like NAD-dependent aldehyde dehydrogenase|nr:aldehyde dehydrogenase family protein [Solirubrobacteraceae bacterium]
MTTASVPALDVAAIVEGVGHLVDGRIFRDGQTFSVDDPSTGRELAQCPEATIELVGAALKAAAAAQPGWTERPIEERRAVLREMADALEREADQVATVISAESGKHISQSSLELQGALIGLRYWAEFEIPVDVVRDDETERVTLERMPVGVVAAIVPWNSPIVLLAHKVGPALLPGNTIVVKPSPFTPLSALVVARIWKDIVPAGVVNIVAGGDDVGKTMVSHKATRMISFTGSIGAGMAIMESAAKDLKRVALELGGNDAAIVLDDVDLKQIAPRLYGHAFMWTGQICAAIKRLYVPREKFEETVQALAELAESERVGGPYEEGVTMGPLTTEQQLNRVKELVDDAVAAGAEVRAGGKPLDRDGWFYSPTILTGVGAGVRVVDEEQFGPVLPVIPYDDVDEAISQANDTDFGLGASVWSNDVERAKQVARRLDAGSTWINRHAVPGADLPFGGVKHSGVGRENGLPGLDHYCELRTVSILYP